MKKPLLIAVASSIFLLSACGNDPGQRALSGAGIGAATGAVGAAVLDANPVAGALVGGAVGGVVGATTTKRQINMGN